MDLTLKLEQSHGGILDRSEASAHAAKAYESALDAMERVVDFGTNLAVRALHTSERTRTDLMVIGFLFKHVLQQADGFCVLVRNGAAPAAQHCLRSAFEAAVALEWILKEDSDSRANTLYVGSLRKQLVWLRASDASRPEHKRIKSEVETLLPDFEQRVIAFDQEASANRAIVEASLQKPEFQQINQKFEALTKSGSKGEPEWYKVCGIGSFRDMAERVGRLPEYLIIYRQTSDALHPSDLRDQVSVPEVGMARLLPIRHLKEADSFIVFMESQLFRSIRLIIGRYRQGEEALLTKKYVEEWRTALTNITRVNYQDAQGNPFF